MKLDDLIKDLTEKHANYGNLDVHIKERYISRYDYREPLTTVMKLPKSNEQIICV